MRDTLLEQAGHEFGCSIASSKELTVEQAGWVLDWLEEQLELAKREARDS